MNQPLLLKPSGKDYLWGGERLKTEYGKNIDMSPLAETWECSTHPDGPSMVVSGAFSGMSLAEVIEAHPEFLGTKHAGKKELPLLLKLIDANQDLSVQVHPDDDYAREHEEGALGKSEMWVVLDATKEAKLVYGFNHDCDASTIRSAIHEGTLMQHLRMIPVKKGDVFFIEAGTVHAIGAGALIAEIQENSNITYRLYDYDRVGHDGQKRALHIDKALDVANLKNSLEPKQPLRVLKYQMGVASELLCRCQYFEVYRMILNTEKDERVDDQNDAMGFRVLLCIDGCGQILFNDEKIDFCKGDCIFIPANSFSLGMRGLAQLLEIRG